MPKRKTQRRRSVFVRFDGLCHYCGVQTDFADGTLDHKFPLSRGGSNRMGNLAWACSPCNQKKADLTAGEYFQLLTKNNV